MHLKHYRPVPQLVPDPMHPGRTVKVVRLVDSGVTVHVTPERTYHADENGWFDFPDDLAEHLRSYRLGGGGWFAVAEVADQVRLGSMDQVDRPAPRSEKRPLQRKDA